MDNVNSLTFRDASLCPDGIEKVIMKRDDLRNKMGEIDVIITSPLKRCVQTTLLTYQNIQDKSIYPIYVMPLVMNYSANPDSLGIPMSQLCSDPDIFSYHNYPALEFKYFMEGFSSQYFPSSFGFNPYTMEWSISDYRMNPHRSEWFFDFVRTHFRGKRIHVMTHSQFIYSIIRYLPNNYETIKVEYNPDNGEFNWNKL
jgi:broad specificity phosphatase PhoE